MIADTNDRALNFIAESQRARKIPVPVVKPLSQSRDMLSFGAV